jgi:Aspartate/tyrosine/aromatic aminotransferase
MAFIEGALNMQLSNRMNSFGEGVFSKLLALKNSRLSSGLPVYDLSVGTPNIPPSQHIIDALAYEVQNTKNYIYAISDIPELQDAASAWYSRRYNVELDPRTEISSLLGSQEGLAHIALAFADEGDVIMVPDPCYPVFGDGPLIAGAKLHYMPQRRENGFVIDLAEIPTEVAKKARLMIVSYPNNPTTAMAPDSFYMDLISFAKVYDIVVLHDNAYSELVFDGKTTGSFLRFEGAKDVGVEFNSLSKTYGLAGARIGFCLGNKDVVSAVKTLKSNMDYGMFIPIQKAAIAAITGDQACVSSTRAAYENRRNFLCDGLTEIGWSVDRCPATMFVWTKIPEHYTSSQEFTMNLLEKTGVIFTPGSAFGPAGEGHVRIALVQDEDVMRTAIDAIRDSGILNK